MTQISIGAQAEQLILPTFQHERCMNCVSTATVAKILREDTHQFQKVMIIDCRYEYEYDGGHIRPEHPRIWVHHIPPDSSEVLEAILFDDLEAAGTDGHAICIIFHCEFSQSRGPKMMEHIRSKDRNLNEGRYPAVYYPQIYLMKGGYNEFFHVLDGAYQDLCFPSGYVRMHDDAHVQQLQENHKKRRRRRPASRLPLGDAESRENTLALAQRMATVAD